METQREMKARNRRKGEVKRRLNGIKRQGCVLCPETNIRLLTFHHLIPSEKDMEISDMVYRRYSWKRIQEELEKCVVMCEKCQRGIHEPNNPVHIEYIVEPILT